MDPLAIRGVWRSAEEPASEGSTVATAGPAAPRVAPRRRHRTGPPSPFAVDTLWCRGGFSLLTPTAHLYVCNPAVPIFHASWDVLRSRHFARFFPLVILPDGPLYASRRLIEASSCFLVVSVTPRDPKYTPDSIQNPQLAAVDFLD